MEDEKKKSPLSTLLLVLAAVEITYLVLKNVKRRR